MRPTFLRFAATSAIAIVLGSGGKTEAQILRFGRLGGIGGIDRYSIRVPSFSIAVSPWGALAAGYPYGPHHGPYGPHHLPDAHPAPYHMSPWFAPQSPHDVFPKAELPDRFSPPDSHFSRRSSRWDAGVSSRYISPQDRYALPISPYAVSRHPDSSRYSLGAPSTPDGRRDRAMTARRLPFARSPYDAGQAQGFGVTGTAPARSLSDRELSDALVRAASELDEALTAQQDGDIWQDYLQPMMIADAFRSASATAANADLLRRLQINFEATAGNEELRWLTEIDGFTATDQLLNEWLRRRSTGDEANWESEAGQETDAGPAIEAERATIEVEELPAPTADAPQIEQPQLAPPQVDPPRRYEL